MGKIIIIVALVFVALLVIVGGIFFYSFYFTIPNKMVTLDESVNNQWANVESVYQRRADLIPNLVNTVKGYAAHEEDVLVGVTQARANATSVNVDASKLDANSIEKFNNAQSGLTSALSKLLVTVEKYPDLKANQNFLELQAQLEGTENRIAVERMRFNEEVKNFNTYIRKFPNSIVAEREGYEPKTSFKADEGSEKAPQVQF